MRFLTSDEKNGVLRLYEEGEKVANIAKQYGIEKSSVSRIAVELGAAPRRPSYFGTKRNSVKVCPRCKKAVNVAGAKYCYHCGADVRSKRDILIEQNEALLKLFAFLPENSRDTFRDTILATIKELKGDKN